MSAGTGLTFVEADLSTDVGWPEAAAGCDYVLHVASPLPATGNITEHEVVMAQSPQLYPDAHILNCRT